MSIFGYILKDIEFLILDKLEIKDLVSLSKTSKYYFYLVKQFLFKYYDFFNNFTRLDICISAIFYGDLDIFIYTFNNFAKKHQIDNLFFIACGINVDIAKYLYNINDNILLSKGFRTAIKYNNINVINWMISIDLFIPYLTNSYEKYIELACKSNKLTILKLLISHFYNLPNTSERFYKYFYGVESIYSYLSRIKYIDRMKKWKICFIINKTLFSNAVKKGYIDIIEYLYNFMISNEYLIQRNIFFNKYNIDPLFDNNMLTNLFIKSYENNDLETAKFLASIRKDNI